MGRLLAVAVLAICLVHSAFSAGFLPVKTVRERRALPTIHENVHGDEEAISPVENDYAFKVGILTWNTADGEKFTATRTEIERSNPNFLTEYANEPMIRAALHIAQGFGKVTPTPELLVVNTQENKDSANLELAIQKFTNNNYELVAKLMTGNTLLRETGHYDSGVHVYVKKGSRLQTALASDQIFPGTFKSNDKVTGSDEKGLKGVYMIFSLDSGRLHTVCFAGTHFKPGSTLEDKKRKLQFRKYEKFMLDWSTHDKTLNGAPYSPSPSIFSFLSRETPKPKATHCDTIFFSGDFNFHTANGWKEHTVHPHFTPNFKVDFSGARMIDRESEVEQLSNYFYRVDKLLETAGHKIEKIEDSIGLIGNHVHLDVVFHQDKLPQTPPFLHVNDEKRLTFWSNPRGLNRRLSRSMLSLTQEDLTPQRYQYAENAQTRWKEGTEKPGNYANLFPSFQPTPLKKILKYPVHGEQVVDVVEPNEHGRVGVRIIETGSKPMGWFRTSRLRNGPDGLYLQACRPVSFADAILHFAPYSSVRALSYGPVIGQSNSDHFPMVGVYEVVIKYIPENHVRRTEVSGTDVPGGDDDSGDDDRGFSVEI